MPTIKLPMAMSAYRMLTRVCAPARRFALRQRVRRGLEDPARIQERLGRSTRPRPDGPLVWLHARGMAEAETALPIMDYLADAHTVLVTTASVPGAEFLADRHPANVIHQYAPLDDVGAARRFLAHWRPDAAVWVESMACLNLLSETIKAGVKSALINATLSDRDYRRWRRIRPLITPLVQHFDMIATQGTHDAAKFKVLGARDVYRFGNLKFATPAPVLDRRAAATLKGKLADRPVWFATNSHEGEEEEIAQAHRLAEAQLPGLLTVILPRRPQRAAAIARTLAFEGLKVARWRQDAPLERDTQICVLPSTLDAGLFYDCAPLVLVGGSLVPRGGQNPLVPAHMGCAVLAGPHMDNFVAPTAELQAAGAIQTVRDSESLAAAIVRLLGNPALMRQRGTAAAQVAHMEWVALGDLIAALAPLLPALAPATPAREAAVA